jgi:Putative HNHc nuclease
MILEELTPEGGAWFRTYVPDITLVEKHLKNGKYMANVEYLDKRLRSLEQIRKWWALLKDIWEYTGYPKLYLHDKFKEVYSEIKGVDPSSLSLQKIDMTTLREMIDLVLRWCMTYDIPLREKTSLLFREDINYLYYLFRKRHCFICGKKGDWHHIVGSKVGMGNNRNKINNVGRSFLCLCRIHHNECEARSEEVFMKRHHLEPIKLTEEQCKELKL